MGSFTPSGAPYPPGDDAASDNWNSYGPAANRVFDDQVTKKVRVERDDQSVALLTRAIQHEIIPRLMLAHRSPKECAESLPFAHGKVSSQEVDAFARLVLSPNESLAMNCIESIRLRGVSIETVYMELLAPAAKVLGQFWEDDLCDFSEVTIGLGKLQQLLHRLSADLSRPDEQASNGLRVLLLPTPGEQHTFGLAMVAEFFRRDGWDVAGGPGESQEAWVQLARSQHFDLIGFSLAVEEHIGQLISCVSTMRKVSFNRRVGIMVGGPVFAANPECAKRVNADVVASSGRDAPAIAENFVTAREDVP
ncbi:B12-binding domain-containing protein [Rhodoferax sp.]|jgi:methanogenic corrinoid protein MtbC1|uniref:B12-binding domain-containing protein n=1 Tax=Rhodoferax sp. TaxID=50421 RepID=UPI0037851D68